MASGKAGKGMNQRKQRRSSRQRSAHDTRRMMRKEKPGDQTMRGGLRPAWEDGPIPPGD